MGLRRREHVQGLLHRVGVSPSAAQDDIKRAYRRKAVELHPDQYGPDAGAFMEMQDAYAVLGDPGKRQSYEPG